jgi:hypothetical protein
MKPSKFIATTISEYFNDQLIVEKINDNFWKWFGNSKTIDDHENPIVFYHGSNVSRRFSKFKNDTPIWFTKHEQYANAFISDSGKTFSVFLKIENPLYVGEIDGIANKAKIQYLSELTNIHVDILNEILKESNGVNVFRITNSNRFKKLVEEMGYDGLEAKEGGGLTTFAALNPNQIKSIKNNGNWDIGNDNINA